MDKAVRARDEVGWPWLIECKTHVRAPVEHELKTWPDFFGPVLSGEKTFELRRNDRDFHAGDTLWLREYVKRTDTYTGRELRCRVTYLLAGLWPGLDTEYVVMSIALSQKGRGEP